VLSSAAALLDELFEHPAWCVPVVTHVSIIEGPACLNCFSSAYLSVSIEARAGLWLMMYRGVV
jgi:hypothetical protein